MAAMIVLLASVFGFFGGLFAYFGLDQSLFTALLIWGASGPCSVVLVALAMAAQAPDRIARLAVLCAAHRPNAVGRAFRRAQRRVLELAIAAGAPEEGVAIARELAIASYRTAEEFNGRFVAEGAVEAYLAHQGRRFAERMSAARYLTLSAAIDRHAIDPAAIRTPSLFFGAHSDQLVSPEDVSALAAGVAGPARRRLISSRYGHDAFLKETPIIAPILVDFLKEQTS